MENARVRPPRCVRVSEIVERPGVRQAVALREAVLGDAEVDERPAPAGERPPGRVAQQRQRPVDRLGVAVGGGLGAGEPVGVRPRGGADPAAAVRDRRASSRSVGGELARGRAGPPARGRRRPRGGRGRCRSRSRPSGARTASSATSEPDTSPRCGNRRSTATSAAHIHARKSSSETSVWSDTRAPRPLARTSGFEVVARDPPADEREVDVLGQVHHRREHDVDQLGGVLVAEHADQRPHPHRLERPADHAARAASALRTACSLSTTGCGAT